MTSLRRQLVLHLLAGTLALYGCWATGFYFYTWHTFNEHFNAALADKVGTFTDLTEVERDGRRRNDGDTRTRVDLEFQRLALPEFQPSPDAMFYQVWARDGRVLARSPSLAGTDLAQPAVVQGDRPVFADVSLPGGERGRAVVLRFTPRLDDELAGDRDVAIANELVLVMARNRRALDDAQAVLVQGFLLFGCLLPIGTAWVVHRSVRRGLLPVNRIASDLAGIGVASLASRVQAESIPDEMRPIAVRLNDLLGRLETAFQRERRLTTDVAHELRTPIAELRILAEMRLREGTDADTGTAVEDMQDVLGIATQMERLMDTLFALARGQERSVPVRLDSYDLSVLIQETWRSHDSIARARHLDVRFSMPERARLRTDAELFGAMLTNLFANAVTYTPEGGQVRIELEPAGGGGWRLRVANTCTQLQAEDLPHVFEPFWRKDEARSDPNRAGLGLALVKTYADVLRVTVSCQLREDDCFVVSLDLPAETA